MLIITPTTDLAALRAQIRQEEASGLLTPTEAGRAQAEVTAALLTPKIRARGFRTRVWS